jgi:Serine/threonine protein kinase
MSYFQFGKAISYGSICGMNNYKIVELICETDNSRLFKAKRIKDKDCQVTDELTYAIKEYKKKKSEYLEQEKDKSQLLEEYSRISVVVPVLETVGENAVVMQFKQNGYFLSELINRFSAGNRSIPVKTILQIAGHILDSLDIMHNCLSSFDEYKGFVHMDIHPGNIFLEGLEEEIFETGEIPEIVQAKFIDMGEALLLDKNGKAQVRKDAISYNLGYSAPELYHLKTASIKENVDIYSVCCLLLELYNLNIQSRDSEYQSVSYLLDSILLTGTREAPYYRFSSAKDMKRQVNAALKLLNSLDSCDYFETAAAAYYMCLDSKLLLQDMSEYKRDNMGRAIEELRKLQLVSRVDADKNLYIYHYIDSIYSNSRDDSYDESIIYLGLSAYNYSGDTEKSLELADRFVEYQRDGKISLSNYINTMNRLTVSYYDAGCFKEALRLQKENIEVLEPIYKAISIITREKKLLIGQEDMTINLGRAYSAYGRYLYTCGVMGIEVSEIIADDEKKTGTELIDIGFDYLKRAIELFKERAGNRLISISHILQMAAETGNRDVFDEYKDEYFIQVKPEDVINGNVDFNEVCRVERDFELHTMFKCIDAFYIDYIKAGRIEAFSGTIRKIEENITSRPSYGYPASLVLFYLADIIYKVNGYKDSDVDYLFELAVPKGSKFDPKGIHADIFTVIGYNLTWRYNAMNTENGSKEDGSNKDLLDRFIGHMESSTTAVSEYAKLAREKGSLEKIILFV